MDRTTMVVRSFFCAKIVHIFAQREQRADKITTFAAENNTTTHKLLCGTGEWYRLEAILPSRNL